MRIYSIDRKDSQPQLQSGRISMGGGKHVEQTSHKKKIGQRNQNLEEGEIFPVNVKDAKRNDPNESDYISGGAKRTSVNEGSAKIGKYHRKEKKNKEKDRKKRKRDKKEKVKEKVRKKSRHNKDINSERDTVAHRSQMILEENQRSHSKNERRRRAIHRR